MKRALLAVILVLLPFTQAVGGEVRGRGVSSDEKRQAVASLASMLRARYVIAETAETMAQAIEDKLARGGYDAFTDAQAFADALEVELRAISHDKHLRVGVAPPPEPTPAPGATATPPSPEAERAAWVAGIRRGNNGLPRAEVLPGNVGVLDVRRLQPPDLAGDTIQAAVAFLAGSDAVIVDLRSCRGGSAHVVPILAGYFFARPTSLHDMVFRGDNITERYWTPGWLPGKRLAEVPMYVLTSSYTFSGAEALAHRFQVLKRATIVGETTGGGANAGGILDVAPFFRAWMPMGRPVDRTTRGNWEGTGVVPDIKTSAREALATAHLEAIKALRAKAATEQDRAWLDFAAERAEGRHHPPSVSLAELQRLVGTYGIYRVWVEGEQLRCEREEEGPLLLVPLTRTVFASETNDPTRIEFVGDAGGRPHKVVVSDGPGAMEEASRTP